MKKTYVVSGLVLAGGVLLSACNMGGGGGEETGGGGDVTIQFMTSSVQEDRLQVIEEMIAAFEAENEGVTVEAVPVEEEQYNTNIITFAQAGQMPAVIEVGNEFVKNLESEQLVDVETTTNLINGMEDGKYYDGILDLVATEDGSGYLAAPLSGWVQGIWYRPSQFEEAGVKVPENWDELRTAAETFTDTGAGQYGIALPTVASVYSEQSFSQFALSNDAQLLSVDGDTVNVHMDSPEMREAVEFYAELSEFTMPGSNDTTEVNDAFTNESAAMAIYSTYILPSIYENGDPSDIGFIIPTEEEEAVFGSITSLTIAAGLDDAEKQAASDFVEFMTQPENMTDWVLMAPGGAQPVSEEVTESDTYQSNEVVQSFGDLFTEVAESFSSIQTFGTVDGRNLAVMGDISASNAIGTMINDVTVQDKPVDQAISDAQSNIQSTVE